VCYELAALLYASNLASVAAAYPSGIDGPWILARVRKSAVEFLAKMPLHQILSYPDALELMEPVVNSLFASDDRIQSLGITQIGNTYGFRATRNIKIALPQRGILSDPDLSVPIEYVDVDDVVRPLRAEQQFQRPLVCGLQIQNFDYDYRAGNIQKREMTTGSIGCFVRRNGNPGFISNNHVLAGENSGYVGDQIVQPGTFTRSGLVGKLEAVVDLLYSPPGSSPKLRNVSWNDVDIAFAAVEQGINYSQSYLPKYTLPAFKGFGVARLNENVFKVGQASGLTRGRIVGISTVVPVRYDNGLCWFRNSFEIVGNSGRPFSQHGDSGAVVVNDIGDIVGVLYATNPPIAYACPIDIALRALHCVLV